MGGCKPWTIVAGESVESGNMAMPLPTTPYVHGLPLPNSIRWRRGMALFTTRGFTHHRACLRAQQPSLPSTGAAVTWTAGSREAWPGWAAPARPDSHAWPRILAPRILPAGQIPDLPTTDDPRPAPPALPS
jgi:hypothetical protein